MDNGREPIDEATMRRLMAVQQETAEQRQVRAAWERIESWLGEHAPGSLAALRPSPRAGEVQELARRIGVRLSPSLIALWSLRPGAYEELPWAAFMLDEMALLPLDRVAEVYEFHMSVAQSSGIDEDKEGAVPHWRAAWVPLCTHGHHEVHPLLYVDLETGRVCFWSRYGDRDPRYESVTDYLEEMADHLESPHLMGGPDPGTRDMRVLVWDSIEPGTRTHDGTPDPA
ncbi:SMI1/KNR4 family protein [Streptomyces sp. NPDC051684]|uniref:SMI1/KNR4 family protein n=1 Tax=Streptomyces sp. NPDC051684 TaxID=3365670 RepID=UPI0037AAA419